MMKGDFKPRTLNFLKKNRFIMVFPESFNIPIYQLRNVKLPMLQMEGDFRLTHSDCVVSFGITENDDLVKTFLSIMEKGETFEFSVELLDSVGVVVEIYLMVGFINRIELTELDNNDDGNLELKISLSINNFKAQ